MEKKMAGTTAWFFSDDTRRTMKSELNQCLYGFLTFLLSSKLREFGRTNCQLSLYRRLSFGRILLVCTCALDFIVQLTLS